MLGAHVPGRGVQNRPSCAVQWGPTLGVTWWEWCRGSTRFCLQVMSWHSWVNQETLFYLRFYRCLRAGDIAGDLLFPLWAAVLTSVRCVQCEHTCLTTRTSC